MSHTEQTPKKSDPAVENLRAFAAHPKVPRFAGRVALGIASVRERTGNWIDASITQRVAKSDQKRAAQKQATKETWANLAQQRAVPKVEREADNTIRQAKRQVRDEKLQAKMNENAVLKEAAAIVDDAAEQIYAEQAQADSVQPDDSDQV